MFGGGFKKDKLRPNLKMAVSRFEIASNKKSALMKQQMREIAKLLDEKPPKEEKARIRAEALIRDDGTIEAYEILQLSCELLSERIKLLASEKNCPEDLKGTIATLMWASNRVDIPELIEIRKQFKAKYGKKFETDALENKDGICNERIMAKLSFQPPSAFLVHTYLEKIADQFEVEWKPAQRLTAEEISAPMAAPTGTSVPIAPGTGLATEAYPVHDMSTVVSELSVHDQVGASAPPSLPMAPIAPSASARVTPVIDRTPSADIPFAQVMPMPPPMPHGKYDDEGEIYVPPVAAVTHGGSVDPKTTGLDDQNSDNDAGSDYDSLKARFAKLKK